jgi:hypothetical protein
MEWTYVCPIRLHRKFDGSHQPDFAYGAGRGGGGFDLHCTGVTRRNARHPALTARQLTNADSGVVIRKR